MHFVTVRLLANKSQRRRNITQNVVIEGRVMPAYSGGWYARTISAQIHNPAVVTPLGERVDQSIACRQREVPMVRRKAMTDEHRLPAFALPLPVSKQLNLPAIFGRYRMHFVREGLFG